MDDEYFFNIHIYNTHNTPNKLMLMLRNLIAFVCIDGDFVPPRDLKSQLFGFLVIHDILIYDAASLGLCIYIEIIITGRNSSQMNTPVFKYRRTWHSAVIAVRTSEPSP